MSYTSGSRGGRGADRDGGRKDRTGAARRTYPMDGPGPRVGRVASNVPRAERVDGPSDEHGAPQENRQYSNYAGNPRGNRGYDKRGGARDDRSYEKRDTRKGDRRYDDHESAPREDRGYERRENARNDQRYDKRDTRKGDRRYDDHESAPHEDRGYEKRENARNDQWYDKRDARTDRGYENRDRRFDDHGPDPRGERQFADPKKRNQAERARRMDERRGPELPPVEPVDMENLLCGRNPIREALRAGRPVEKLLVAQGDLSGAARDIVKMAKEAGVVVQMVDRTRLDQIYPAHQGLLAYVAAAPYSTVEEMLDGAKEKGEDPFLILLDGITDPHNLGAIIRTAECVGAHGVILPERRAAGLTPAAAKAAAGALNHMKIARVTNLNRTIDELKAQGVWIIGASMDGESAFSASLTGPAALVIGSEGDGISKLTLEKCDLKVSLPMKGHIESLNASVAAGVLMYEIARARAL